MTMDSRNTNTGAVENRAVTSVGGMVRRVECVSGCSVCVGRVCEVSVCV